MGENDFDAVAGRASALAGMNDRGWVLGRSGGTESWRGGVEMRAAAGGWLRRDPDGGPNERGTEETGASITGAWLEDTGMFGALCGIIAVPGDASRSDERFDVPTTAIGEGVRSDGGGGPFTPGGMMLPSGEVMLIVEGCALFDDGGGGATAGVPCGCVLLDIT